MQAEQAILASKHQMPGEAEANPYRKWDSPEKAELFRRRILGPIAIADTELDRATPPNGVASWEEFTKPELGVPYDEQFRRECLNEQIGTSKPALPPAAVEKVVDAAGNVGYKVPHSLLVEVGLRPRPLDPTAPQYADRPGAFTRKWLQPLTITNDELDRAVDTDKPVRVIDREPEVVQCQLTGPNRNRPVHELIDVAPMPRQAFFFETPFEYEPIATRYEQLPSSQALLDEGMAALLDSIGVPRHAADDLPIPMLTDGLDEMADYARRIDGLLATDSRVTLVVPTDGADPHHVVRAKPE